MEAKHLNFNLFKSDLDKFKTAATSDTISDLLTNYITEYESQGVSSSDDILSMFLIVAIKLKEYKVIEQCLNLLTDEGITLTTTDKTGYSAITSMLFSGDENIQSAFDSYLAKIPSTINKVEATEKDFKNIVTMLEYPQLDGLNLDTCLQNYIAPLYSASCLGNISEIFGLD